MTDLSQELILLLLAEAFLSGAALGVTYEVVRICRLLLYSERSAARRALSQIFVFFTDLVFLIIASSVAILLTYNISGGVFRGCLYIAMASGLFLYRVTVGLVLLKIEAFATGIVKKIIKTVLKILFLPFKMIFSLFIKLYRLTIGRIIGKIVCRTRYKREKRTITSENVCAEHIMSESIQEKEDSADKHEGYRKESRIRF